MRLCRRPVRRVLTMRVCLMVEGQEGVSWDQWLALADACERFGFEGLFRSDHYLAIGGPPELGSLDAWATLAGLAARTSRIRLGTLVSPATFRHPSVLAKSAATVDHISGGRVELGIGAGWYEAEHRAYGFPFPDVTTRLELFAEQLEIVRRQWTEERVDFAGRHYALVACPAEPKPVQRPGPPLIVGGSAKRGTVGPAVRFADEYNTIFVGPEECRRRREALDRACEAAGRDPESLAFSLMTQCVVGRDEAEVRRRLERVGGAEDGAIVGTVAEVAAQLGALEAAGVERVMLQHLAHDDLDAVQLLGEELIPAVAPA